MKFVLPLRLAGTALAVILVGCGAGVKDGPGVGEERPAEGDTAGEGPVEDTGLNSPEDTGRAPDDDSTEDSSEVADDSGVDTATTGCALPFEGYFVYSEILLDGTCGSDTTLLDIYGFTVGFSLHWTDSDTFGLTYDGFSLDPSCVQAEDCTFTCSLEEDHGSLGIMGIDAKLDYSIETSGETVSSLSLKGEHAITLSCDGSEETCAMVAEDIVGAALPCSGVLTWMADHAE